MGSERSEEQNNAQPRMIEWEGWCSSRRKKNTQHDKRTNAEFILRTPLKFETSYTHIHRHRQTDGQTDTERTLFVLYKMFFFLLLARSHSVNDSFSYTNIYLSNENDFTCNTHKGGQFCWLFVAVVVAYSPRMNKPTSLVRCCPRRCHIRSRWHHILLIAFTLWWRECRCSVVFMDKSLTLFQFSIFIPATNCCPLYSLVHSNTHSFRVDCV